MKKRCLFMMALMMMSCLLFFKTDINAASKVDKAYNSYVKELKKTEFRNGIYTATVSVKNQNKLLLVSNNAWDSISSYVKVYQYYKGKVRYIGEFYCGDTSYPLMKRSGTLIGCGNHFINMLTVKNGKGYWTEITGYYLENRSPYLHYTAVLKNNIKSNMTKKEISERTALTYQKIYNGRNATIINFKKR